MFSIRAAKATPLIATSKLSMITPVKSYNYK